MEEADKDWMMIRMVGTGWVSVSSGTKGRKMVVVVACVLSSVLL